MVPPTGWLPYWTPWLLLQVGHIALVFSHLSMHSMQKVWPQLRDLGTMGSSVQMTHGSLGHEGLLPGDAAAAGWELLWSMTDWSMPTKSLAISIIDFRVSWSVSTIWISVMDLLGLSAYLFTAVYSPPIKVSTSLLLASFFPGNKKSKTVQALHQFHV